MMKLPMKMLVAVPSLPRSTISSSAHGVPETAMPGAGASQRGADEHHRVVGRTAM